MKLLQRLHILKEINIYIHSKISFCKVNLENGNLSLGVKQPFEGKWGLGSSANSRQVLGHATGREEAPILPL